MKKVIVLLAFTLLTMTISCGKKNSDSQPQTQHSIVPANLFAQIPGTKVGN